MNVYEKLMNIQSELKAPKSQYNSFGKYKYRNLEDILEALKPLLAKYKAIINISDEIELAGDRYYVKATARIFDIEKSNEYVESTAYAREDENKKGMDLSQLSGSTSSYARKYALNGLFAIDDTKDADTTNTQGKEENYKPNQPHKSNAKESNNISEGQIKRLYAIGYSKGLDANKINAQVKTKFNKDVKDLTKAEYDTVCKGYENMKG